jgi:hypothetical protein
MEAKSYQPASCCRYLLHFITCISRALSNTCCLIKVGKNTLYSLKQQKIGWEQAGELTKFVTKIAIHRSKKPVYFKKEVVDWLLENTRPSSNSKNMVTYKDETAHKQKHITQWREESLRQLFKRCKLTLEHGQLLHRTYFYSSIPKFVKMVKPMEALCPYHMTFRKWTKELERKRMQWHVLADKLLKCVCLCIFCSGAGCAHGKTPDTGTCASNTCLRCKDHKCPAEWTEAAPLTVWYTSALKKRLGGGNFWQDKEHTGSRLSMMSKWEEEMKAFEAHNERNIWNKEKVDWLKRNIPHDNVLIKADFIQNYEHSRGQESDSAYYNKRQTQLLTFVVWYHSKESTDDKPVIKIKYYDYLSGYLKHTSLFFQKCFMHLLEILKKDLPYKPRKVLNMMGKTVIFLARCRARHGAKPFLIFLFCRFG